jgi:hypothetical protein
MLAVFAIISSTNGTALVQALNTSDILLVNASASQGALSGACAWPLYSFFCCSNDDKEPPFVAHLLCPISLG